MFYYIIIYRYLTASHTHAKYSLHYYLTEKYIIYLYDRSYCLSIYYTHLGLTVIHTHTNNWKNFAAVRYLFIKRIRVILLYGHMQFFLESRASCVPSYNKYTLYYYYFIYLFSYYSFLAFFLPLYICFLHCVCLAWAECHHHHHRLCTFMYA